MKIITKIAIGCVLTALCACNSTKQIVYMQDMQPVTDQVIANLNTIKVQPGDVLSIIVTCKDPKLASLFNLISSTNRLYGASGEMRFNSSGEMSGYTVTQSGDIDFPQLGMVHVAGLTREQIAAEIKNKLVSSALIKDPVVTVDYVNLHFSVIGEVAKPGYYSISNDRTTLLDALGQAGDLTVYGKRDRVFVIREENGKRSTYQIDLRSKDLFNSPAYYLQQNDVIYVEPNKTRAGQSSVNENQWKNVGIWTSLASVLTSIAVLIFR